LTFEGSTNEENLRRNVTTEDLIAKFTRVVSWESTETLFFVNSWPKVFSNYCPRGQPRFLMTPLNFANGYAVREIMG
jgi:hypothetical protein